MISIQRLSSADMTARLPELADILIDAVTHGASVNFLADLSHDQAVAFWSRHIEGVAASATFLYAAENEGRLVATVMLFLAPQPNAPHRAEIGKMLVHSTMRRQGLGRRLLTTAEDAARSLGRTLLLLDTEAGSSGDILYRACGWTAFGTVPGHSMRPSGEISSATFFYKHLAA